MGPTSAKLAPWVPDITTGSEAGAQLLLVGADTRRPCAGSRVWHASRSGPELAGQRRGLDPPLGADLVEWAFELVAVVERLLPRTTPAVICGWSMGGLVAMMVAGRLPIAGLILVEPSLPAEVQGVRDGVVPLRGTFDPDAIYGPRADGIAARPDSLYALNERRRGVFVGHVGCPTPVIGGRDFGATRSEPVANHLGAELEQFSSLGHVDLLHDANVLGCVSRWLDRLRLVH